MLKNRSQCGLILENKTGEVLLQRRDDNNQIQFPNLLGTFGGEIEMGETPEQAILRELKEELKGYNPDILDFWRTFYYEGYLIYMFKKKEPNFNLEEVVVTEGQFGEWISEDYAREQEKDFAFNCREIILAYFDENKY